jgi:hypothetical protein
VGNWSISIHGHGQHDNSHDEKDADQMAVNFVAALQQAGHTIESARFVAGGGYDINVPKQGEGV